MALDGTYNGLKASVADWLNRADLTAAIPDFITLAEAQMGRRLILLGAPRQMIGRSDATIDAEFVAVPADFLAARTIYLEEDLTKSLQFCTPEQINEKKSNTTQLTGKPLFYSVVGTEFQFFPAPVDDYAAELTYYKGIAALSVSNTTNWVLANHPDAYLYGACLQAAPYLKDDARLSVWAAAFETILSDISAAGRVGNTSTYIAVPDVSGGTP